MPILAMHLIGNSVSGERYKTTIVILLSKPLDLQNFIHLVYLISMIVRWHGIFLHRKEFKNNKKTNQIYDGFCSLYMMMYADVLVLASIHFTSYKKMTLERFKILNNMSPPVLSDLINQIQVSFLCCLFSFRLC